MAVRQVRQPSRLPPLELAWRQVSLTAILSDDDDWRSGPMDWKGAKSGTAARDIIVDLDELLMICRYATEYASVVLHK